MSSQDKFLKNVSSYPYRYDKGTIIMMGDYDECSGPIDGPLHRHANPIRIDFTNEKVIARDVRILFDDSMEDYENPYEFHILFSDMNFRTLQYVLIQFGYSMISTVTHNISDLIIDNSVIRRLDIDQSQYTKAQSIWFPREIEYGQSLGSVKYIYFGSVEDGIDCFNTYPKRIPASAIEYYTGFGRDSDDLSFSLMNFICDSNDRFRARGITTPSNIQQTSIVDGNTLHRSINNVEYVQLSYASQYNWGDPTPIQTGVSNIEYVVDALNDTISLNMNQTLQNLSHIHI